MRAAWQADEINKLCVSANVAGQRRETETREAGKDDRGLLAKHPIGAGLLVVAPTAVVCSSRGEAGLVSSSCARKKF